MRKILQNSNLVLKISDQTHTSPKVTRLEPVTKVPYYLMAYLNKFHLFIF